MNAARPPPRRASGPRVHGELLDAWPVVLAEGASWEGAPGSCPTAETCRGPHAALTAATRR